MFDLQATNELDVSYNHKITNRGWQSMVAMIKKSQALKTLATRGFPVSISMAANLGQALMVSFIHTLKLEHCGLAGRPIANLCKPFFLFVKQLNRTNVFFCRHLIA